ncbi:MAG: glutamine synthetase adenylyltransferase [Planctomycetota bacterium]|nr:MAG: glutamine synthetase adenylyltransferase [Planctomycetota bacterium]
MIDPSDCLRLLQATRAADAGAKEIVAPVGFEDVSLAVTRLRGLAEDDESQRALAQTLPALLAALSDSAAPDSSLLNFERLVQAASDRTDLFHYLASNPRAVEILVRLFVGSQFLTEILLRNPDYLKQLVESKRLAEFKNRGEFCEAGRAECAGADGFGEEIDALRRFQQWELMRLAACDAFGLMDLKTVTLQLALLADSLVQNCLSIACSDLGIAADDFAVIAFGKLGGEELNYSSDIDLVFVCERGAERYWGLGQKLIKAISEPTGEGFLYRVDMRLRPWGNSGALVTTCDGYYDYLKQHGRLWEKQALLKARVIAGNMEVGNDLLHRLTPIVFDITEDEARANVLDMKQRIEEHLKQNGREWGEVKAGQGSIRDVEFVTQFLQLAHGRETPAVRSANTLDGLVRLADLDFLEGTEFRELSSGYIFLRTIEHALQIMHNKQVHSLPEHVRDLAYLARRLDFPGPLEFRRHYDQHCRAIRAIFEKYILLSAEDRATGSRQPPPSVATHLGEAAASYKELFDSEQADRHLWLLNELDERLGVKTDVAALADRRWELTIVGYDQLGDLSLMCGLLLVYGFDIESGYVFTGDEVAEPRTDVPVDAATRRRRRAAAVARRRKYVNVFRVRSAQADVATATWECYESDLRDLRGMSRREAQGALIKRVARSIPAEPVSDHSLLPVEIQIDNSASAEATVMHIRAEDTIGFLYELTNALALSGTSVQRMWIASQGTQVVDTLWVLDEGGTKIVEPGRLNELRAAVVLIKHFTHLLPQSSNPESALHNFREFLESLFQRPDWIEDLALLQNSEALAALARLLGVSDFLWHDFLRLQHSNLFPVVTDVAGLQSPRTPRELQNELQSMLESADSLESRRAALNAFKDREMLRVDMRHILDLQDKFGMFAQELTDVAEAVVRGACWICTEELRPRFGEPRLESGAPCRLSVCALGKCGGAELGFASDIELMFVFEAEGHTSGPEAITNTEYFQKLVDLFVASIHAKRKGIFEIDLRLRPYGKAGSPAVALETFEKYFGHDGPAWPYERQALVKLRPIAGDVEFSEAVVAVRDGICYSGRPFDVNAMRGMPEKQVRQLVRAGTFNAKLSPGGLVDSEYLVQALQMTYGHLHPELRTTNTRAALRALEATGILSHEDRVRLRDAYRFLRRVIDALRMVRGDARDLTVPAEDSEEFEFLARRLGFVDRVDELTERLQRHTETVVEMGKLLDELPQSV